MKKPKPSLSSSSVTSFNKKSKDTYTKTNTLSTSSTQSKIKPTKSVLTYKVYDNNQQHHKKVQQVVQLQNNSSSRQMAFFSQKTNLQNKIQASPYQTIITPASSSPLCIVKLEFDEKAYEIPVHQKSNIIEMADTFICQIEHLIIGQTKKDEDIREQRQLDNRCNRKVNKSDKEMIQILRNQIAYQIFEQIVSIIKVQQQLLNNQSQNQQHQKTTFNNNSNKNLIQQYNKENLYKQNQQQLQRCNILTQIVHKYSKTYQYAKHIKQQNKKNSQINYFVTNNKNQIFDHGQLHCVVDKCQNQERKLQVQFIKHQRGLYERGQKSLEKKKERQKSFIKEKLKTQESLCTFQPDIAMSRESLTKRKKSYQNFKGYAQQHSDRSNLNQQLSSRSGCSSGASCHSRTPNCTRARTQICSQKGENQKESIFDKLYRHAQQLQIKKNFQKKEFFEQKQAILKKQCPFQPKIDECSQLIIELKNKLSVSTAHTGGQVNHRCFNSFFSSSDVRNTYYPKEQFNKKSKATKRNDQQQLLLLQKCSLMTQMIQETDENDDEYGQQYEQQRSRRVRTNNDQYTAALLVKQLENTKQTKRQSSLQCSATNGTRVNLNISEILSNCRQNINSSNNRYEKYQLASKTTLQNIQKPKNLNKRKPQQKLKNIASKTNQPKKQLNKQNISNTVVKKGHAAVKKNKKANNSNPKPTVSQIQIFQKLNRLSQQQNLNKRKQQSNTERIYTDFCDHNHNDDNYLQNNDQLYGSNNKGQNNDDEQSQQEDHKICLTERKSVQQISNKMMINMPTEISHNQQHDYDDYNSRFIVETSPLKNNNVGCSWDSFTSLKKNKKNGNSNNENQDQKIKTSNSTTSKKILQKPKINQLFVNNDSLVSTSSITSNIYQAQPQKIITDAQNVINTNLYDHSNPNPKVTIPKPTFFRSPSILIDQMIQKITRPQLIQQNLHIDPNTRELLAFVMKSICLKKCHSLQEFRERFINVYYDVINQEQRTLMKKWVVDQGNDDGDESDDQSDVNQDYEEQSFRQQQYSQNSNNSHFESHNKQLQSSRSKNYYVDSLDSIEQEMSISDDAEREQDDSFSNQKQNISIDNFADVTKQPIRTTMKQKQKRYFQQQNKNEIIYQKFKRNICQQKLLNHQYIPTTTTITKGTVNGFICSNEEPAAGQSSIFEILQ